MLSVGDYFISGHSENSASIWAGVSKIEKGVVTAHVINGVYDITFSLKTAEVLPNGIKFKADVYGEKHDMVITYFPAPSRGDYNEVIDTLRERIRAGDNGSLDYILSGTKLIGVDFKELFSEEEVKVLSRNRRIAYLVKAAIQSIDVGDSAELFSAVQDLKQQIREDNLPAF
jgi:hypothetical protein